MILTFFISLFTINLTDKRPEINAWKTCVALFIHCFPKKIIKLINVVILHNETFQEPTNHSYWENILNVSIVTAWNFISNILSHNMSWGGAREWWKKSFKNYVKIFFGLWSPSKKPHKILWRIFLPVPPICCHPLSDISFDLTVGKPCNLIH